MKGFTPDIHGNIGLTWPLMPETWQPHFKETTFTSTRIRKHLNCLFNDRVLRRQVTSRLLPTPPTGAPTAPDMPRPAGPRAAILRRVARRGTRRFAARYSHAHPHLHVCVCVYLSLSLFLSLFLSLSLLRNPFSSTTEPPAQLSAYQKLPQHTIPP